jgi:ketosteroid isomerase-like protein
MNRFLVALNNLDLSAMSTLYDENATTFSPSRAERIEGSAVAVAMREQFDSIRSRSQKSGPSYLNVQPQQMRIDRISPDVAVVSFHLKNDTGVGRRTLVWKRFSDGWKIVHLHASTLNMAP